MKDYTKKVKEDFIKETNELLKQTEEHNAIGQMILLRHRAQKLIRLLDEFIEIANKLKDGDSDEE